MLLLLTDVMSIYMWKMLNPHLYCDQEILTG